jgi:hypothetical protein
MLEDPIALASRDEGSFPGQEEPNKSPRIRNVFYIEAVPKLIDWMLTRTILEKPLSALFMGVLN